MFPKSGEQTLVHRPVIGSGPAGLFCAYVLAKHGYRPLVLERGESAEQRKKSVDAFWKTGVLNPESNVQFGRGRRRYVFGWKIKHFSEGSIRQKP